MLTKLDLMDKGTNALDVSFCFFFSFFLERKNFHYMIVLKYEDISMYNVYIFVCSGFHFIMEYPCIILFEKANC